MRRLLWAVVVVGVVAATFGSSGVGAEVTVEGNEVVSQSGPLAGTPENGDGFGSSLAAGDFNGDGFDDVVIGVWSEDLGGIENAGMVHVVLGSVSGLDVDGAAAFSQSGPIAGRPEHGDRFGSTLATGDFNGDGYVDVAIGAPGETIGVHSFSAGMVHVLFGGPGGVTVAGSQSFTQNGLVLGGAEPSDGFGGGLTTGDFDGDGFDDLAIGSPGEGIGPLRCLQAACEMGLVIVLHGSAAGLTTAGREVLIEPRGPSVGGYFGASMAAADFDGDGLDDLAVAASCFESRVVGCVGGVVHVYAGRTGSLILRRSITQAGPIIGVAERDDCFGGCSQQTLTAGDFDGDGYADLAVGVPGEALGDIWAAGRVAVIYGTAAGLTSEGNHSFSQRGSIAGTPERDDRFGHTLAAGDLDGDGQVDLAIGVPHEAIGERLGAGLVHVLYGTAGGLQRENSQAFKQTGPIAGRSEQGDGFGESLVVADIDGDGANDLLIGAPGEGLGDIAMAGVVHVLRGTVD